LFTGAVIHSGRENSGLEYGVIGEGGSRENGAKQLLAHRAAWTVYRGEIPAGMHVLHHCDVPLCCNPDHLFLGTHDDNMADCVRKGRAGGKRKSEAARGSKNPAAKLNETAVKTMRERRAAGWKFVDLAEAFHVSDTQARRICTGRSWQAIH
jgi:hypothetical protein